MKHSTFRKSSLISSVALLLVAIVALSGATFAWFSSNTTAQAGTLEMTATSANGLWIADDSESLSAVGTAPEDASRWSGTVTWTNKVDGMSATSTGMNAFPPSFFKTSTNNVDGSHDGTLIEGATAGTEYLVKKVWVKAGTTDPVTLKCTVNIDGSSIKGYERVAIVNATAAGNETFNVFANSTDTANGFTDTAGSTVAVPASAKGTFDAVTTADIGSTPQCFYIYCWFEGQDTDCYNLNASANFKVDLSFSLA